MKGLLQISQISALLCALPFAASAATPARAVPDPVAYKCYLCTPEEMRDVARSKGPGTQYVYDFELPLIVGYTVSTSGGSTTAVPFDPEAWIQKQFFAFVQQYQTSEDLSISFNNVRIFAAGSDHALSLDERYISGHNLSALHPDNVIEREKVNRYLQRHAPAFLRTDDPQGRLLRLEYMQPQSIQATLYFGQNYGIHTRFYFDYDARSWVHLWATDGQYAIQDTAEDFIVDPIRGRYSYFSSEKQQLQQFLDRATWAGIAITGSIPDTSYIDVRCTRDENLQIGCVISDM